MNCIGFASTIKTDGLSVLCWMDVTGQRHIPSLRDHGDKQCNCQSLVSKDICGSVFWQIELRLIIYFSTHLRSCLEIRPHGSKVKVTSCTCERLAVWWMLSRQTHPSASSSEVRVRKNNQSASGLLVEYCGRVILSICIDKSVIFFFFLTRRVFLIHWTKNKGSSCIYFSFFSKFFS